MKVNIEFELPDEQYDLDCALNGRKYRQVIWDMDNMLRSNIKWNDKLSDDAQLAYQECRTALHNALESYNLDINE